MLLPDVIYPPKPLWSDGFEVQDGAYIDRGFLHSIAIKKTSREVFFRKKSTASFKVPNEQIEEYLAKLRASGPEGLAFVERYLDRVFEENNQEGHQVNGLHIGDDPEPICVVGGPWHGGRLSLLEGNETGQIHLVDYKKLQMESDDGGVTWRPSYPDTGFE